MIVGIAVKFGVTISDDMCFKLVHNKKNCSHWESHSSTTNGWVMYSHRVLAWI